MLSCYFPQVLSGDSIVVRDPPRGQKPVETNLIFAWITAPKVARKKGDGYTEDEPYGWEVREFLRKKLVGKEIKFKAEQQSNKEHIYASVFLDDENLTETLVSKGYATVMDNVKSRNADNEQVKKLLALEEEAKKSGRGIHSNQPSALKREIAHEAKEGDLVQGKTYDGIVEYVINGSTLKIALEVSKLKYKVATVFLSGVKCPGPKEEFNDQATFFTESRLLQRDVRVRIEQTPKNGGQFIGSVTCGNNNLAEHLLREGMAKTNWTISKALDPSKLRAAEAEAKTKKLRLFKDYVETKSNNESWVARVLEVVNADAVVVERQDTGEQKKLFLASIRPPRPEKDEKITKPLYEIPFLFEAREFLRTKLVGKRVKVHIDYVQKSVETSENVKYPEKTCATIVTVDGNENVAESLVARGLATVVKYRNEDDSRASNYGALLDAEEKAKNAKKGLHGPKDKGIVRIVELSNDLAKAKQFFPFLNKKGVSNRTDAVVEYVFSASRIKIYIPKQNCACNLILAGVNTPRSNAEYGPESITFVKSALLQRSVQVTIDAMDKVGNFIGNLYYEGNKNLAVELLTHGFASIRDDRGSELKAAEDAAKAARLNIWKDWKEEENDGAGDEEEKENEDETGENGDAKDVEKKDDRKAILITQVADDLSHFYAQFVDDGPALDSLMNEMREELSSNPPLPGAYTAKKGDIVAAKFSLDGQWYRAKIEKLIEGKKVEVLYIDYGNREVIPSVSCVPLPSSKYNVASFKEAIHKFALAFVSLPDDKEVVEETRSIFETEIADKILLLRSEYKDSNGIECVTVADKSSKQDVVLKMVEDGLFVVKRERRRERRLQKVLAEYRNAQESAKKNRVSFFFFH